MPLGNLVRLIRLELDEIPIHPSIVKYLKSSSHSQHDSRGDPSSKGHPDLKRFIKGVLDEAKNFVDPDIPTSFKKKATKSNPPSSARIDVLQRMISSEEIKQIPFQDVKIPRKASRAEQSNGEAW